MTRQRISGWGRTAWTTADVVTAESAAELARLVSASHRRGAIARGLGRAYGAAAQNAGGTVITCAHDDGSTQIQLDVATGWSPRRRASALTHCYGSVCRRVGSFPSLRERGSSLLVEQLHLTCTERIIMSTAASASTSSASKCWCRRGKKWFFRRRRMHHGSGPLSEEWVSPES